MSKISGDSQFKEVTDWLSLYEKNPTYKVRYIDPDKDPTLIPIRLIPMITMDSSEYDFVYACCQMAMKKEESWNIMTVRSSI